MFVRQLLNPSEEEIDRATRVLFETNGSNPFIVGRHGWDKSLLYDNFRSRVEVGSADGWVYVVSVEEGGIDGVIYVQPPGWDFGESRTRPGGVPNHLERVSEDIKQWHATTFIPNWDNFHDKAFGPSTPATPSITRASLYINLLGVDPVFQKRGLGRILLQTLVEQADQEGVPMSLFTMSEENVRWYTTFGFSTSHYDTVDIRGDKVPVWAMIRSKKE